MTTFLETGRQEGRATFEDFVIHHFGVQEEMGKVL